MLKTDVTLFKYEIPLERSRFADRLCEEECRATDNCAEGSHTTHGVMALGTLKDSAKNSSPSKSGAALSRGRMLKGKKLARSGNGRAGALA